MLYSLCVADWAPEINPVIIKDGIIKGIETAKSLGFGGIEIHIKEPALLNCGPIEEALELNGITVTSIASGLGAEAFHYSLSSPDKSEREKAIRAYEEYLILAGRFSSKVILGYFKGDLPPGASRDQYKKRLMESLLICAENAGKHGATIIIEPLNRYIDTFLMDTTETMDIIETIGSDRVGIMLDTCHMALEGYDMESDIRMCAEKLLHFHLSEADRFYPGHGGIDFKHVLKCLKSIDYTNALGFEYRPLPNPIQSAQKGLSYIDRCLAAI